MTGSVFAFIFWRFAFVAFFAFLTRFIALLTMKSAAVVFAAFRTFGTVIAQTILSIAAIFFASARTFSAVIAQTFLRTAIFFASARTGCTVIT